MADDDVDLEADDEPPPKTADAKYWAVRDQRAKALKAERALARDKGEWLQVADARAAMTRLVVEVVRELERLRQALPPKMEGMRAVEMGALMEEAHRDLQERISRDRAVGAPMKRGRGRPRKAKAT